MFGLVLMLSWKMSSQRCQFGRLDLGVLPSAVGVIPCEMTKGLIETAENWPFYSHVAASFSHVQAFLAASSTFC